MATTRRGIPHTLSSSRIAQLHRWQLLGAAARKGRKTANRDIHHAKRAKSRRAVLAPALKTAAWGISKTANPLQLVAPIVPGYQPGERTYKPTRRKWGG
jgi:hypothetical protein